MPNALLGATIAAWTALIIYLVVSAARGRLGGMLRSSFGKFHPYLFLAGFAVTVGQLSFFVAITYASVSYVSTVAASETLLTIFLAVILVGRSEAITRRVVVAAVAVFGSMVEYRRAWDSILDGYLTVTQTNTGEPRRTHS